MNNEGLQYVSSSPLLETAPEEVSSKDEQDIGVIEALLELVKTRKEFYESIASLDEGNTAFSVKEQVAINRRVLSLINEIDTLLSNKIKEVRGQ